MGIDAESPAKKVVRLFGGYEPVRAAVGLRNTLQVRRWDYPKAKGGHDGNVPSRHHAALLAHARDRGISLRPADLLPWLDGPADVDPSKKEAAAHGAAA